MRGECTSPSAARTCPILSAARARAFGGTPQSRLFVERAGDANPDFTLTADNAGDRRHLQPLDGLPLAIELAAARTNPLRPLVLLDKLDNRRLPLLTGGPATPRPPHPAQRHRLELRPARQRGADPLARLGVFAGGCTLPALEAVCNAHGDFPVHVLELASLLCLTRTCCSRTAVRKPPRRAPGVRPHNVEMYANSPTGTAGSRRDSLLCAACTASTICRSSKLPYPSCRGPNRSPGSSGSTGSTTT